jgi:hypothetical protein
MARSFACPMTETNSLDGIIAYLTRIHGGNVQDKGIVTITSSSAWDQTRGLSNLADLTSQAGLELRNISGYWMCWDFGGMRVCPTHYTIKATNFKTWVLEGGLDSKTWTVIHREKELWGFGGLAVRAVSFAIEHRAEFRFLRLVLRDESSTRMSAQNVVAVEFFGTLLK